MNGKVKLCNVFACEYYCPQSNVVNRPKFVQKTVRFLINNKTRKN